MALPLGFSPYQPGTSIQDLIAAGYAPGDPFAFFDVLPQSPFGTTVGQTTMPPALLAEQAQRARQLETQRTAQTQQHGLLGLPGEALQKTINAHALLGSRQPFSPTGPALAAGAGGAGFSDLVGPGVAEQIQKLGGPGTEALPFLSENLPSGVGSAAEQSAFLGAQGLGDIPSTGVSAGGAGLSGAGTALAGFGGAAGLAGGLNQALSAESSLGKAGGATSAAGGALTIASIFQPELLPFAIGLDIAGGGLSLGDLLGGGPSSAWRSFGGRLAGTIGSEVNAAQALETALSGARTREDVSQDLTAFRNAVQAGGVGGFAGAPGLIGPPGFQIPGLPGAGGSTHEGGVVFDPSGTERALGSDISQALGRISGLQNPFSPSSGSAGGGTMGGPGGPPVRTGLRERGAGATSSPFFGDTSGQLDTAVLDANRFLATSRG